MMEMDIAALSMSMASAKFQDSLSIGLMKMSMESSEQSADLITEMLEKMPSPDGRGTVLDVRV